MACQLFMVEFAVAIGIIYLRFEHAHNRLLTNITQYIQMVWLVRMFGTGSLVTQIARFIGPTWGPPGPCRPQMLAPWTLLSGNVDVTSITCFHYWDQYWLSVIESLRNTIQLNLTLEISNLENWLLKCLENFSHFVQVLAQSFRANTVMRYTQTLENGWH